MLNPTADWLLMTNKKKYFLTLNTNTFRDWTEIIIFLRQRLVFSLQRIKITLLQTSQSNHEIVLVLMPDLYERTKMDLEGWITQRGAVCAYLDLEHGRGGEQMLRCDFGGQYREQRPSSSTREELRPSSTSGAHTAWSPSCPCISTIL